MAGAAVGRRRFLAASGVLGMAVVTGAPGRWLLPRASAVEVPSELVALLEAVAHDTFSGLVAWVVPGPDAYSRAQGETNPRPGGIAAKGAEFLLASADDFVPNPDALFRPVAAAAVQGFADTGFALPRELALVPDQVASSLDDALAAVLAGDGAIPLSLVFALEMNQLAVRVDPTSLGGPFPSPFANLDVAAKAAAWEIFEQGDPELIARLDGTLPEPERQTVSGVLQFAAGALVEFAAFGTYGEWSVFDARTRRLRSRPPSWTWTGYQPDGPVHGWDELKGYYRDVREVRG